jgi:hypothetical protein
MAAINARRLGVRRWLRRPALLLVAWIIAGFLLPDAYVAALGWYVLAVVAIWWADLRRQQALFEGRPRHAGDASRGDGRWLVPTLAGAPLAVLGILTFVVAPLVPPGPRDVALAFAHARSAAAARDRAMPNLWPAIDAMFAAQDGAGLGVAGDAPFEVTGEQDGAPGVGGRLVAWRAYVSVPDGDGPALTTHVSEGAFHLTDAGGAWKVDEWYFTAWDGQAHDPVAMSTGYRGLFSPLPQQVMPAASASGAAPDRSAGAERPAGRSLQGWMSGRAFGAVARWIGGGEAAGAERDAAAVVHDARGIGTAARAVFAAVGGFVACVVALFRRRKPGDGDNRQNGSSG